MTTEGCRHACGDVVISVRCGGGSMRTGGGLVHQGAGLVCEGGVSAVTSYGTCTGSSSVFKRSRRIQIKSGMPRSSESVSVWSGAGQKSGESKISLPSVIYASL